MPELPEVETVRRGLNQISLERLIRGGDVRLSRSIAYPDSIEAFLKGITNTCLSGWQRRGKYLLGGLKTPAGEPAGYLGGHLRMTGQFIWAARQDPVPKHCRVRLFLDPDRDLRFIDQRTFGRLWWVPPHQSPEIIIPGIADLGPEPFSDRFSPEYLYKATRRRQRPIKNALLDQALIAGMGNIYADEALFLSGIKPTVLCAHLGRKRLTSLHEAIRQVLAAGIAEGGTTFSDFRDLHGVNGNYGGIAKVYGRENQPCRVCATPIRRIKLAGRSAHYCPCCQR